MANIDLEKSEQRLKPLQKLIQEAEEDSKSNSDQLDRVNRLIADYEQIDNFCKKELELLNAERVDLESRLRPSPASTDPTTSDAPAPSPALPTASTSHVQPRRFLKSVAAAFTR